MKFYDKGSLFGVTVGKAEVHAWKRRWPASGLGDGPCYFEFNKRNGDLVDVKGPGAHSWADGPGLVALSYDAQRWGKERGTGKSVRFRYGFRS